MKNTKSTTQRTRYERAKVLCLGMSYPKLDDQICDFFGYKTDSICNQTNNNQNDRIGTTANDKKRSMAAASTITPFEFRNKKKVYAAPFQKLKEKDIKNPACVYECVERRIITEMDGRDLLRCLITERCCAVDVYTVSQERGCFYRNDRHVECNFNRTHSFISSLQKAFGETIQFDQIVLDYFWIPPGWSNQHWNRSFMEQTIPALAEQQIIKVLVRRPRKFRLRSTSGIEKAIERSKSNNTEPIVNEAAVVSSKKRRRTSHKTFTIDSIRRSRKQQKQQKEQPQENNATEAIELSNGDNGLKCTPGKQMPADVAAAHCGNKPTIHIDDENIDDATSSIQCQQYGANSTTSSSNEALGVIDSDVESCNIAICTAEENVSMTPLRNNESETITASDTSSQPDVISSNHVNVIVDPKNSSPSPDISMPCIIDDEEKSEQQQTTEVSTDYIDQCINDETIVVEGSGTDNTTFNITTDGNRNDSSNAETRSVNCTKNNKDLIPDDDESSTSGMIYLPFCFYIFKEVISCAEILLKYYDIEFLRKGGMELNDISLWFGTQQISPFKMQTILGKQLNQEDIYCTFALKDLKGFMVKEKDASVEELLRVASRLDDFNSIRFIALQPIPINMQGKRLWKGEIHGLVDPSQVTNGIVPTTPQIEEDEYFENNIVSKKKQTQRNVAPVAVVKKVLSERDKRARRRSFPDRKIVPPQKKKSRSPKEKAQVLNKPTTGSSAIEMDQGTNEQCKPNSLSAVEKQLVDVLAGTSIINDISQTTEDILAPVQHVQSRLDLTTIAASLGTHDWCDHRAIEGGTVTEGQSDKLVQRRTQEIVTPKQQALRPKRHTPIQDQLTTRAGNVKRNGECSCRETKIVTGVENHSEKSEEGSSTVFPIFTTPDEMHTPKVQALLQDLTTTNTTIDVSNDTCNHREMKTGTVVESRAEESVQSSSIIHLSTATEEIITAESLQQVPTSLVELGSSGCPSYSSCRSADDMSSVVQSSDISNCIQTITCKTELEYIYECLVTVPSDAFDTVNVLGKRDKIIEDNNKAKQGSKHFGYVNREALNSETMIEDNEKRSESNMYRSDPNLNTSNIQERLSTERICSLQNPKYDEDISMKQSNATCRFEPQKLESVAMPTTFMTLETDKTIHMHDRNKQSIPQADMSTKRSIISRKTRCCSMEDMQLIQRAMKQYLKQYNAMIKAAKVN